MPARSRTTAPADLPRVIPDKLAGFAATQQRVRVACAVAETLLALVGLVLVVAVVLWALRPGLWTRVGLSTLVYVGAVGVLFFRALLPGRPRARLADLAAQFEAAVGGRLEERLLSAVELADSKPPGTSDWMRQQTFGLAASEIAPLDAEALVDREPLRKAWRLAAPAALLLALAWALDAPFIRPVLNPFGAAPVTPGTWLRVSPGNCRVGVGDSVEILATAQPLPDAVTMQVRWADGLKEELALKGPAETNAFRRTLTAVSQGFRYRVRAGGSVSPEFSVQVDAPPRLAKLQVQVTPPAYAGWAPRTVNSGDADILLGSRVSLEATLAGEPARTVELIPADGPPRALDLKSNVATAELAPETSLGYGLRLTGANGLSAQPADHWQLRVFPDEPPVATLAGEGLETKAVGPEEALVLHATAQDDVGLRGLELLVSSGTNVIRQRLAWKTTSPLDTPGQAVEAAGMLNLAEHAFEMGEEIRLEAEATDRKGQVGRSQPLQLTLLKPEGAEAAHLAQRLRERLSETDAAGEALRQVRGQWLAWTRQAANDPASAAADARLVRQRLSQVRDTLVIVGTNIFAEAGRTKLTIAPYLVGLAGALSAWANAQHSILSQAMDDALAAEPAQRPEAVSRGRDLFNHALEEFLQMRSRVALAPLALEAEAMVARGELAQGRYKRGLPVLRAAMGWDAQAQVGLWASFYAGRELAGAPVVEQVGLPRFDDIQVPGLGRENWSARYQGELSVPEAGKWTFACRANDGVRLFVDGQSLLPAEAWAAQGARDHQVSVQLAVGWHALKLEFFQAAGHNQLHLRLGKEGGPLTEVAPLSLRSSPPRPTVPQAAAATVDSRALPGATNRLEQSFTSVARVSGELNSVTNDLPRPELVRLAESKSDLGPQVRTNLTKLAAWTPLEATATEALGDELVGAAQEARRLILELLNQLRWKWRGPAELQTARVPLEQVRAAADAMRPMAWENKRRQDLLQRRSEDFHAAAAWANELKTGATALEQKFFADARNPEAGLAERTRALRASMKLHGEVQDAARRIEQSLAAAPTARQMLDQVDRELERLENAFNEVLDASDFREKADIARAARGGLRQMQRGQQLAVEGSVQQIAATERRRGDNPTAEGLERAAGQANPNELTSRLRNLARLDQESPPSLGETIPPPMNSEVSQLERTPGAQRQVAADLAEPRLGLALEAARLRREGARKPAAAYNQLGRDLGQLMQTPSNLSPQTLRPLAERAAALAGRNGGPAREQEINAGWERAQQQAPSRANKPGADDLADRLDELSAQAKEAVGNQAKRAPLTQDLEEMANPPAQPNEDQSLAAATAGEAHQEIQGAPSKGDSYQEASRTLAAGASELRLREAGREAENAQSQAEQAQNGKPGERPRGTPRPNSRPQEGDYARPVGSASGLDQAVTGAEQADWAKLREKVETALRQGGIEHFPEEQQEAIRAYFKRLATEK